MKRLSSTNFWQFARVSVLLVAIFILGIVMGRLSVKPTNAVASPWDLQVLAQQTGDMLTERYGLDQDQEGSVREIIDRMVGEMRPFDDLAPVERARKRRDVWRRYLSEFRGVIPPEHAEDFEERIAMMERRLERSIRRRERRAEERN